MRVCDLMHKGVIFCYVDDTAHDVARIMESNQVRSVVVVNEKGEVWGLISHMELIPLYGKDLDAIRAEEIMRPYRIEIHPQWTIEKAIEIMKKLKYYHLIIVDPHVGTKWPVGMLTSYDVMWYMSGLKAGKFEQILKMHTE
ncbi:MAG: CBS domain-containing protein [Alphaproteobacteria bacterium]|uniref:CBS domain-containing protein n=1 Tax=Candidatus Nitrobium versatile TaxID=2884831 RepID=A0A953M2X6_9BACT|nr:CBS domain-containing protein [Candidatus Nitrobium versatile]